MKELANLSKARYTEIPCEMRQVRLLLSSFKICDFIFLSPIGFEGRTYAKSKMTKMIETLDGQ